MKKTERKVITLELEASEYAMLYDTLIAASQVKSKKFPLLRQRAEKLLEKLEGEDGKS